MTNREPTMTATPHRLRAEHLRLGYDADDVVADLSIAIPAAAFTVIVGANACGKSTLLRALARLLRPRGGTVLLDGSDIHRLPSRQVARKLGILPQGPVAPEGITVVDLVRRGRHPHQRWYRPASADDEAAVAAALAATDMSGLANRPVDELSGGQRQRAWIAMALAQGTDILLLDEPTTFLDLAHQVEVLDLLADLNETEGRTVVAVLHDLNQASRYAQHLVAMAGGRVAAVGPPATVVTTDTVRAVFGLDVRVIDDPVTGTPLVVPLSRSDRAAAASGRVPSPGGEAPPEVTGASEASEVAEVAGKPGAAVRA
jgi:iron complex transport system ATP-binding protein